MVGPPLQEVAKEALVEAEKGLTAIKAAATQVRAVPARPAP